MTTPPRPGARPPTRRAIMELVEASPDGLTAAELGRALDLHPNGVRKQLATLVAEGAVGAHRVPTAGRGRPALRYRAAEDRREQAALRRLTGLLLDLVVEMEPDEGRVEEVGRRSAADLSTAEDGREALLEALTALGFAPVEASGPTQRASGALEVVVGRCPFTAVMDRHSTPLVCALHRGISRGLIERTAGARLTGFITQPPERAGCRIRATQPSTTTG